MVSGDARSVKEQEQTDASTAPAVVPAMSECKGFSFFDMAAWGFDVRRDFRDAQNTGYAAVSTSTS